MTSIHLIAYDNGAGLSRDAALLAGLYRFDPVAMAMAIERVLAMDVREIAAIGAHARAWYETNDREFRARIARAIAAA